VTISGGGGAGGVISNDSRDRCIYQCGGDAEEAVRAACAPHSNLMITVCRRGKSDKPATIQIQNNPRDGASMRKANANALYLHHLRSGFAIDPGTALVKSHQTIGIGRTWACGRGFHTSISIPEILLAQHLQQPDGWHVLRLPRIDARNDGRRNKNCSKPAEWQRPEEWFINILNGMRRYALRYCDSSSAHQ